MKLRNKKTGEIVEREEFRLAKQAEGEGVWIAEIFNSIAEITQRWEDYKPAEPLIKEDSQGSSSVG